MAADSFLRLPYSFARKHGVCLQTQGEGTVIAYKAGLAPAAFAEVRRFAGRGAAGRLLTPDAFEQMLAQSYAHDSGAAQKFADDAEETLTLERIADTVDRDLLAQEDDAPVIRLINALLLEAIREQASDIHIEPFESALVIRLRVDGILRQTLALQPALAALLVSRIKVMAQLDIAERRLPQDGRISLRVGGNEVDVRVSTLAAGAGERVVLRLLPRRAEGFSLEQLGLRPEQLAALHAMTGKPHGIILVTGPTGSGKTTTLYGMLSRLNDRSRNILTIEDPVEYQIEGIGQTQVNSRVDLTFARGLRAILRQDPDVVMVGEIRDAETARIAVQASLTGHLVLSTLHTGSAIGAVARLADMGVESFLLSSSLAGLVSQRLVRSLCPDCRDPYTASAAECAALGVTARKPPVLYRARGCASCRHSGYRGRFGLYEIIAVDGALRAMIHAGAGEQAMLALVRGQSPGIRDEGCSSALQGRTTIEEIMRVTTESYGSV